MVSRTPLAAIVFCLSLRLRLRLHCVVKPAWDLALVSLGFVDNFRVDVRIPRDVLRRFLSFSSKSVPWGSLLGAYFRFWECLEIVFGLGAKWLHFQL